MAAAVAGTVALRARPEPGIQPGGLPQLRTPAEPSPALAGRGGRRPGEPGGAQRGSGARERGCAVSAGAWYPALGTGPAAPSAPLRRSVRRPLSA